MPAKSQPEQAWCECCNGMYRNHSSIIVVGSPGGVAYCGYCDHKTTDHQPLSVRKKTTEGDHPKDLLSKHETIN